MKMSRDSLANAILRGLILLLVAIITYIKTELLLGLAIFSSTMLFFTEAIEPVEAFLMRRKMPRTERLISDAAMLIGLVMLTLTFLADVIMPTIAICAPLFVLMPVIRYWLREEGES